MKKIFTLLFAVGIVGIASAQSNRFDHNKQEVAYSFNGQRSAIQQINREYDYKIAAVKMNRRMNSWEKSKQIRRLENMRDAEIASLKFRFDNNNHHYGDNKFKKEDGHRW